MPQPLSLPPRISSPLTVYVACLQHTGPCRKARAWPCPPSGSRSGSAGGTSARRAAGGASTTSGTWTLWACRVRCAVPRCDALLCCAFDAALPVGHGHCGRAGCGALRCDVLLCCAFDAASPLEHGRCGRAGCAALWHDVLCCACCCMLCYAARGSQLPRQSRRTPPFLLQHTPSSQTAHNSTQAWRRRLSCWPPSSPSSSG